MRKIALTVAVAVALPNLIAADHPKETKVQRSPGGTKTLAKGKETLKLNPSQGKKLGGKGRVKGQDDWHKAPPTQKK